MKNPGCLVSLFRVSQSVSTVGGGNPDRGKPLASHLLCIRKRGHNPAAAGACEVGISLSILHGGLYKYVIISISQTIVLYGRWTRQWTTRDCTDNCKDILKGFLKERIDWSVKTEFAVSKCKLLDESITLHLKT